MSAAELADLAVGAEFNFLDLAPSPPQPRIEHRDPAVNALFDAAIAAWKAKDDVGALAIYQRLLKIDALLPVVWGNIGEIMVRQRHYHTALVCARRSLALQHPESPIPWGNLGTVLMRLQRFPEAADAFQHALALDRENYAAWHNLGAAAYAMGDPELTMSCHLAAFHLKPGDKRLMGDYGLAMLAAGDYQGGFRANEGRWANLYKFPVWHFGIPRWQGEPIAGTRFLLHHEQGFGDSLQFVRFARLLRQRGAHVTVADRPELLRLFAASDLADAVIDWKELHRSRDSFVFDFWSPMLSAPGFFELTPETVPPAPYLRLPDSAVAQITRKRGTRLAVGIVWAGSTHHELDLYRSMPFTAMLPLAEIPGVSLYSLQYGPRSADIAAHGAGHVVDDLAPLIGDFADTGALLRQLDLVISIDSAVVHLAGALDVPCFALLAHPRCWRWLRGRSDTPWYRSVSLWEQSQPSDWAELINRVSLALLPEPVTVSRPSRVAPAIPRDPGDADAVVSALVAETAAQRNPT
jgi:tetratricopeptide (TPR) repeat protein